MNGKREFGSVKYKKKGLFLRETREAGVAAYSEVPHSGNRTLSLAAEFFTLDMIL